MSERGYVPSLVPWMVAVAMLSAGSRVGLEHTLTGSTRYVLLGAGVVVVWIVSRSLQYTRIPISPPKVILTTGVFVAVAAASLLARSIAGTATLFWSILSVGVAVVLTFGIWLLLERWRPAVAERTGLAGGVLLFGQLLDAITTMLGIDVLGFYERIARCCFVTRQK